MFVSACLRNTRSSKGGKSDDCENASAIFMSRTGWLAGSRNIMILVMNDIPLNWGKPILLMSTGPGCGVQAAIFAKLSS